MHAPARRRRCASPHQAWIGEGGGMALLKRERKMIVFLSLLSLSIEKKKRKKMNKKKKKRAHLDFFRLLAHKISRRRRSKQEEAKTEFLPIVPSSLRFSRDASAQTGTPSLCVHACIEHGRWAGRELAVERKKTRRIPLLLSLATSDDDDAKIISHRQHAQMLPQAGYAAFGGRDDVRGLKYVY